jgi:hypothetical protein
MEAMREVVRAIDAVARAPAYLERVAEHLPPIARFSPGPVGVFMGYDFHLTTAGPQLIEINTNAGGAFLNAQLARAQRACCREVEQAVRTITEIERFERAVVAMFESEWRRQRGDRALGSVAIVDDRPESQALYPEFRLVQALFSAHGIESVIVDPRELELRAGALTARGTQIDLVYNRLVDFSLDEVEHATLREAYLNDLVVLTPGPRAHALLADKRNLVVLGNEETLLGIGVDAPSARLLASAVPRTIVVTPENADELWAERRELFFKPVSGFASKGVYRGAKLTRGTFAKLLEAEYVAQRYVPPSERLVKVAGETRPLKVDVRLYSYDGEALLSAARMYRGQATNLSTPGGGFAPVFQV